MYEIIGYVASVIVAVSLMMSSILRLRILNLIGALVFTVYGVLIGAAPVAAVNLFIVGINIWYLVRIHRAAEYFRILEVRPDAEYLRYFLELTRHDIERHMPGVSSREQSADLTFFVLRNVVPAGLVMGEMRDDGAFRVHVDYVLPDFRDFKVGRFLYADESGFLHRRGIRRIEARAATAGHARYLRRMGFTPGTVPGEELYVRTLPPAGT